MDSFDQTPSRSGDDAEALAGALELELQAKRVAWQQTRQRRGLFRALSLLFLLLVILGALFAYFYLQPQLRERAAKSPSPAAESTR